MEAVDAEQQPLWTPSPERVARSNLTRFRQRLAARRDLRLADYASLHRWSLERPDMFWFEMAHFADVRADWADAPVLRQPVYAAMHLRHRITPMHRRLLRIVQRHFTGR